jgi:hypothetical protein
MDLDHVGMRLKARKSELEAQGGNGGQSAATKRLNA